MNTNKNININTFNLKAELDKRNIEIVPLVNCANIESDFYTFDELVARQKEGLTGVIVEFAEDDILTEEFNKVFNNPANSEKIINFLNDESFLECKDLDDVMCLFKCKRKGIAKCVCLDKTFELEDFTVKLSRRDPKTGEMSKGKVILTIQDAVVPKEVIRYLKDKDDATYIAVLINTIANSVRYPNSYSYAGELDFKNETNHYNPIDVKMQIAESTYGYYQRLELLAEREETTDNAYKYSCMLWVCTRNLEEIYLAQDSKYHRICRTKTDILYENQCIYALKHYNQNGLFMAKHDMEEFRKLLVRLIGFEYSNMDIWRLTGLFATLGINNENATEFTLPFFFYIWDILTEEELMCIYDKDNLNENQYLVRGVLCALLPLAPKVISKEIDKLMKNLEMNDDFFDEVCSFLESQA